MEGDKDIVIIIDKYDNVIFLYPAERAIKREGQREGGRDRRKYLTWSVPTFGHAQALLTQPVCLAGKT